MSPFCDKYAYRLGFDLGPWIVNPNPNLGWVAEISNYLLRIAYESVLCFGLENGAIHIQHDWDGLVRS
jgi:hypothetical protein